MATVNVVVTLKPSLLDAQGKVVESALQHLGYAGVEGVRIGKFVELSLPDGPDLDARVRGICEKLLANPVIEDFRYEVVGSTAEGGGEAFASLSEWDTLIADGVAGGNTV